MSTDGPPSFVDPLDTFEAPFRAQLRSICDSIGYGRTIQLVENWYEEKHPGWKEARNATLARRSRSGKKGAR